MDKKKKMLPTGLEADVQGGASDPCPAHQPTSSQIPEHLSMLMRFVDRANISRAYSRAWEGTHGVKVWTHTCGTVVS